MARPRKSPASSVEKVKDDSSPYSGKVGGNPYVAYVSYKPEGEEYPRVLVYSFLGAYAAKWFLTKIIGEDDYEVGKWKYNELDTDLTTSFGVHVRMAGDQIDQLLAYEFANVFEETWKDERLGKAIAYLKWGRWEHKSSNDTITVDTEDGPQERPMSRKEKRDAERAARREEKNRKREADPAKVKKPKVDKTGMVTAGSLAERLNILPREIRAVFRKLKLEKPDGGWLFTEAEAEDIVKKVKKALK